MSKELIQSVLEDVNKARKVLKLPPLSDLPKGNHSYCGCPIAKALPLPDGENPSVSVYFIENLKLVAYQAIASAWGVKYYSHGGVHTTDNIADFVRIFDNHQLPQYEEEQVNGED